MLLSDEYNELADVWSLGITAFELAVGEPPHAKLHSMRAAVKIPQSAPPTLPDPETWSGEFKSFIALSLTKDPTRRPSAEALLQHPFIVRAAEPTVLQPMVAQRERDAASSQRKAADVGSGDSLDSLDEVAAAPLSKAQMQPKTQPQAQPHTQAARQASQTQQASSAPAGSQANASDRDMQRGELGSSGSAYRSRNDVNDERGATGRSIQQQQQQQPEDGALDDTHTRTLPHPEPTADSDASPPGRLRLMQATQLAQEQQQTHVLHERSRHSSQHEADESARSSASNASSSTRRFFPSLPSAAASSHSSSLHSPASTSPSSSSQCRDEADGEWAEASSGARQADGRSKLASGATPFQRTPNGEARHERTPTYS